MITTFIYNGSPRLLLKPENDVERLILSEMAEKSEKGCTTALKSPAEGALEFALYVGEKS